MEFNDETGIISGTPAEIFEYVSLQEADALKYLEESTTTKKRKNGWSHEDDHYIMYSGDSFKKMARKLGRSLQAIYKRRSNLRIKYGWPDAL